MTRFQSISALFRSTYAITANQYLNSLDGTKAEKHQVFDVWECYSLFAMTLSIKLNI